MLVFLVLVYVVINLRNFSAYKLLKFFMCLIVITFILPVQFGCNTVSKAEHNLTTLLKSDIHNMFYEEGGAVLDGKLYLLRSGMLYEFEGEQHTNTFSLNVPQPLQIASDGTEMYVLGLGAEDGLQLYRCGIDGSSISVRSSVALEWDGEIFMESLQNERSIAMFARENAVSILMPDAYGETVYIAQMDVETGKCLARHDVGRYARTFLQRSNGEYIVIQYLPDNFAHNAVACRLDPESGSGLAELFEMGPAKGFAYDADSDALYYVKNGLLYAVRNLNPAEEVAICTISDTSWDSAQGYLWGDGYVFSSGYEIVWYDTAQQIDLAEVLVVNDPTESFRESHVEFTRQNPASPITLSAEYLNSQDILTAILTQDSRIDIYRLAMSSDAFQALRARGYLADIGLEGSAGQMVKSAIPQVREWLIQDGQLLALPISMTVTSAISYAPQVAQMSGISLPTTWGELIGEVSRLIEESAAPGSILFPPDNPPLTLLQCAFESYCLSFNKDRGAISFDTEEFLSILQALEVFPAADGSAAFASSPYSLFVATPGNIAPSDTQVPYAALPLRFDGWESPLYCADVEVYVINPYSDNIPLAREYLNFIAEALPAYTKYALSPYDATPLRPRDYEFVIARSQERIDELRQRLENADDAETEALENQLRQAEEQLANYAEMAWAYSQEQLENYIHCIDQIVIDHALPFGENTHATVRDLFARFLAGQMDAYALIEQLESKAQMITLEGY